MRNETDKQVKIERSVDNDNLKNIRFIGFSLRKVLNMS